MPFSPVAGVVGSEELNGQENRRDHPDADPEQHAAVERRGFLDCPSALLPAKFLSVETLGFLSWVGFFVPERGQRQCLLGSFSRLPSAI